MFTLRLFLPTVHEATRRVSQRMPIREPIGAGKTVLVVDDDALHREMILEALTPYDFAVHFAKTGADCLGVLKSTQPDLFLLDIEMPGMTGWDLAQHLRMQENTKAKIVMLSASAMEEYGNAMKAPFHDAFVMKPVDIARLLETIADLLDLTSKRETSPGVIAGDEPLSSLALPDQAVIQDLILQCEIGYTTGLRERLAASVSANPDLQPFVNHMLRYLDADDLRALMSALESVSEPVS